MDNNRNPFCHVLLNSKFFWEMNKPIRFAEYVSILKFCDFLNQIGQEAIFYKLGPLL
jgi:hypothetical protein